MSLRRPGVIKQHKPNQTKPCYHADPKDSMLKADSAQTQGFLCCCVIVSSLEIMPELFDKLFMYKNVKYTFFPLTCLCKADFSLMVVYFKGDLHAWRFIVI